MRRPLLAITVALCAAMAAPALRGQQNAAPYPAVSGVSGEALYGQRCAGCHDNATGRTPSKAALQGLTPGRMLRTLDFGAMMTIAYPLRRVESRQGGMPGNVLVAFAPR